MSGGIEEMAKSAVYTHTNGKKYVAVSEEAYAECFGCCFLLTNKSCGAGNKEMRCRTEEVIFKPLQTPLEIAEEDLVKKGTPMVGGVRTFDTGATRDTDDGKHDIEAFFSPLVTKRRAEYMHLHRKQKDGVIRDGDNWQLGMPYKQSLKSLCRHVEDVKLISRGYVVMVEIFDGEGEKPLCIEDAICAAMFNLESMLLTRLEEGKTNPEWATCETCKHDPMKCCDIIGACDEYDRWESINP